MDILKKINLENIKYLDLANIELKNIDFLSNTSLKNLKELNLDNNKIEDISLLKKENIVFNDIQIFEIINNHITQGIEILKNEFVTKCLYMNIDISSFEDKNKILIFFEEPNYSFEIYIIESNPAGSYLSQNLTFSQLLLGRVISMTIVIQHFLLVIYNCYVLNYNHY